MDSPCPLVGGTSLFLLVFYCLMVFRESIEGYQPSTSPWEGVVRGIPTSSRPVSRVELPKITISVVEPRSVRNDKQRVTLSCLLSLLSFECSVSIQYDKHRFIQLVL